MSNANATKGTAVLIATTAAMPPSPTQTALTSSVPPFITPRCSTHSLHDKDTMSEAIRQWRSDTSLVAHWNHQYLTRSVVGLTFRTTSTGPSSCGSSAQVTSTLPTCTWSITSKTTSSSSCLEPRVTSRSSFSNRNRTKCSRELLRLPSTWRSASTIQPSRGSSNRQ